jgi:ActR/RegA family two-component response regulator
MPQPPDIVLLATDWQPRALIRAQLMEDGFEVVATNTWPMMRRHLRPGTKPRLAIVDLKGLPNPGGVLGDLRVLMTPERVLVLTAMGTVPTANIQRLGFHVLSRPIVIEKIVQEAASAIRSSGAPAARAVD